MKTTENKSIGKSSKYASKRVPKEETSKFKEFFLAELADIHGAEKQLLKGLKDMVKAATSEELKLAFKQHLEQTENHVVRIEKAFESMGEKAKSKTCEAMAGLLEEAKSIIEDTEEGTMVRDAALIFAAQKVEHYEIATYGGLATVAELLGLNEAAELLKETIGEEKETDENLTELAASFINEEAMAE